MSDNKQNPSGVPNNSGADQGKDETLAEQVLREQGKSKEEIESTGQVVRADADVEATYSDVGKTVNSAPHRAVWSNKVPYDQFRVRPVAPVESDRARSTAVQAAMERSIAVVKQHKAAGTLFNADNGKVSDQAEKDLGAAGYWGLLIPTEYGGLAATNSEFFPFLTRMAAEGEPTIEGMASIHQCIGAVYPLKRFGNEEQKRRYLPRLASGDLLSFFALTEPGAGSSMPDISTEAVLDGDNYVLNGEKMFISNAKEGRLGVIICNIEGKKSALLVELPNQQNDNFSIDRYKIHVVRHIHNVGLKFTNFLVPKANLLGQVGDGLKIAYGGLNYGRVAVLAGSAGFARQFLSLMKEWSGYRETFGTPIKDRQLVKGRIGRVAALIVAMDAQVRWSSAMLDKGYRGELECIQAKVFGSEAMKEIGELAMRTQGGRSFLEGNIVGEDFLEIMAAMIYEGENELLTVKYAASALDAHGMQFMKPIADGIASQRIGKFNPANPIHLWKMKSALIPLTIWIAGKTLSRPDKYKGGDVSAKLQRHLDFAAKMFRVLPLEFNQTMITFQQKLAGEHLVLLAMSQRMMNSVTIPIVVFHAQVLGDEASLLAANAECLELEQTIQGGAVTNNARNRERFRAYDKLADLVLAGKFTQLNNVPVQPITRPYASKPKVSTKK